MPDLDRKLRDLLTDDNLQVPARRDAARIVHDGVRRRRRRRAIAMSAATAAAVGATIAAATALPAAFDAGSKSPTPTQPSGYDVAWVDKPAPKLWLPTPFPPKPPTMNAPRCLASQLHVGNVVGNGATGRMFGIIPLRNTSSSPCLLIGRPARVVAQTPGKPDVVATRGLHLGSGGVGGDLQPGKRGYLTIETDRDCPARYATPNTFPTNNYTSLTVALPSGTSFTLPMTLDVECGLRTGGLGIDTPPARTPPDLRDNLQASISSPKQAKPGRSFDYVVTLANPTAVAISLQHCPGYVEWLGTQDQGVAKESLGLNCSSLHEIAPGQSVRYQMRITVPADAAPGPLELDWTLATKGGPEASSTVLVL